MNLLIIRHGKSMDRDTFAKTGKEDHLRPLSQEGAMLMKQNASGLQNIYPDLERIVTSPLTRAVQTANTVSDQFDVKLERDKTESLEPQSHPSEFVEWYNDRDDPGRTAIVGHKPNLGLLTSYLLSSESQDSMINFKKGAAVLLQFPEHVIQAGTGKLEWFLTPEQLREFVNS